MTSRRSGRLLIRLTILALGLTVSLGAGFAQAHDPRLDEAFLALQKAEGLVEAALGANEPLRTARRSTTGGWSASA